MVKEYMTGINANNEPYKIEKCGEKGMQELKKKCEAWLKESTWKSKKY